MVQRHARRARAAFSSARCRAGGAASAAARCGRRAAAAARAAVRARDVVPIGSPAESWRGAARCAVRPAWARAVAFPRQRTGARAAAAARAFAARDGRAVRVAALHRPSCRNRAWAQVAAVRPHSSVVAAGRGSARHARYWARRRCRSGRRSSADVRHCRAGPAPGAAGHRPRQRRSRQGAASAALGIGADPAAGESADQPGSDADQRQHDDERDDEGDWAALHTCPRQMALFSCPWVGLTPTDGRCPKLRFLNVPRQVLPSPTLNNL